jgi:N-methylhydantoinase B
VEARTPITVNSQIERTQCAPWGLEGGHEALANRISVRRADGTVVTPPNGKLYSYQLDPGDVYVVESGGGGGFGDSLDRPTATVAEDVRLGYVSAEAARRDYAVVFDEGLNVDEAATARQRTQLRQAGSSGRS